MSMATLKSKFNSLESGTSLVFEPGVYSISEVLKINGGDDPLVELSIVAEQPYTVTIRQTTNDEGIFEFDQDDTQTWLIDGLIFEWSSQQTSSHTDSVAIAFSGAGNSFYDGKISNCKFLKGFRGISIEGTGTVTVSNSQIENCQFQEFIGSAIRLASPTAAGMAGNSIESVFVHNYNSTNTEDQIYLSGQTAMTMLNN